MTKLFHVSDVHFGAEDPDALDWFARCVAEEKPDAVVMTGDLTMRAKTEEFEAGAAWLKGLNVPVTVEIGNHDVPYYSDFLRRILDPYARYAAVERMLERPLAVPGVTVVPLKTVARLQWRVDQSKGIVSARSLAAAVRQIAAAPKDHLILVAAHHPLLDIGLTEATRTHGGAAALEKLAAAGADAVLTGHVHYPFDTPVERAGRTVRMIGAGTLSKRLRHSPPAFNEIRAEGRHFETIARTMSPAPKETLGEGRADVPV
ncbi:metallophosphoesterase [Sphingomonas sp.]|jgi:3',5'-cyclic AMP phosphodiesterase CpdA|uniref:metallophosphoesterase family protein n=1 Tax=Sphingomonas sp. TaxID=28214 RepID=UPI002D7E4040|nr:metallophosphoesterase [Sphingomonas sp.]HEU0045291.1 metallophosphoesterase [Sphingomonas sp.]